MKTFLTILMLCATLSVFAQAPPPHAASTQTWRTGELTWSDQIVTPIADCIPTDTLATIAEPPPQYRVINGRYYYNWTCVNIAKEVLCPSPWRMPALADFEKMDGATRNVVLSSGWGYGGLVVGSTLDGQGSSAYYWSSTESDQKAAYYLRTLNGSVHVYFTSKHHGFLVRCVR
jgi:hypothetical protein